MGEIKITEKSTKAQILEAYNQALKEHHSKMQKQQQKIQCSQKKSLSSIKI